jgi:hypothetical protein
MSPLRWGVILLAVGALAGCGGGGTSPGSRTGGLYGTVTRGPTSPVCRAGIPCWEPASGARLLFRQNGRAAASVVVAKDGSYSVKLAPGTYTVAVPPQPSVGGITPMTVRVVAGRTRKVAFQVDTGMR